MEQALNYFSKETVEQDVSSLLIITMLYAKNTDSQDELNLTLKGSTAYTND